MALQPSQLILCGRLHSVPSASIRVGIYRLNPGLGMDDADADPNLSLAARLKQIPLNLHSPRDSPFLERYPHLRKLPHANGPILWAKYGNGESLALTQSLNILDFLEDSYPGHRRLIPSVTDMAARGMVKDLAASIVCGIKPMQDWKVLHGLERRKQDPIASARSFLAQGMKAFEGMAAKSAGVYSVGNEISIADICLVTMVQAAYRYGSTFDRVKDHSGIMQYPTIERIVKECEKIPSFMQAEYRKKS